MSLQGQRTTTTSMDWEDFKSLLGKLERDGELKFCLLFAVGVFTGLRISDLLRLRFSHFENTEILSVQEQKTGKVRRIKINPDLREIIERVRKKMGVTDSQQYMFVNRFGTKAIDKSYVNLKLKQILKNYKIDVEGNVSSHMFRKTLGNRVLRLNNYSNESVILLMELFGHSSVAITKKYLGIREREIYDVYDSLRL